ncbi:MAG: tryptophan-rich sensory protein [Taibaiella sp.]|nr:tryptophan-rich sensory protein [Taibaiella sp.]
MEQKKKNIDKVRALKWWQIALISVAVSALAGLTGLRSSKKEKKLYNVKLKQAPWAPPAFLFAPAWATINFFLLNAIKRILSSDLPEKRKLLLLQAGIWAIFFSFNYVYFRKKSPVLAAIWTLSDSVLAIASLVISMKNDKKTALNFFPLVLWTTYAGTIADYQALKNPDPVFNTKALLG